MATTSSQRECPAQKQVGPAPVQGRTLPFHNKTIQNGEEVTSE